MLRVEIRVKGQIDPHWTAWFEGLKIDHTEQDETVLTGQVTDQSALYGLLSRLRDLSLPLVSVCSARLDDCSAQPSVQPEG